jgi:hypothetical protein
MSKENGEELFRALHSLLDAIFVLNLKALKAVVKQARAEERAERGESLIEAATKSSKGKVKVAKPD